MRIIEPYYKIEDDLNPGQILLNLEKAARVCYKSEDKLDSKPNLSFLKSLINQKHESILEHEKITVRFVCDRGISHEIVRHRIGSYSQESTRYCNYSKNKFGNNLTFIQPCFFDEQDKRYSIWKESMLKIEKAYFDLINNGAQPQEARSVLPNSLKTEIVVTFNLRSWRHFFNLRCPETAHPQIRQLAIPLLKEFQDRIPVIFDDIEF